MSDMVWIELSTADIQLVTKALAQLRLTALGGVSELNQLANRLETAVASPGVTIGVYGGLVQWTRGNPFPIRIVDYDGERAEMPDMDDQGHPCSIWNEPPDPHLAAAGL